MLKLTRQLQSQCALRKQRRELKQLLVKVMIILHVHVRQACLDCFLFNPRSTLTTVCVCQRVYRLQALSSAEGPWKCTFCPTSMALHSAAALALHLRLLHGDRAYLCDFCRFLSASATAAAEHRLRHEATCPYCFMKFQFGALFNAHFNTHKKERLKPVPKPRLALVCASSHVVLAVHCVFVLLVQGQ